MRPWATPHPSRPSTSPRRNRAAISWRLTVPDGCGFLTYKAVGSTGRLRDGEEGSAGLARRILVTESLPLPIRGRQTKKFEFTKLLESGSRRPSVTRA